MKAQQCGSLPILIGRELEQAGISGSKGKRGSEEAESGKRIRISVELIQVSFYCAVFKAREY